MHLDDDSKGLFTLELNWTPVRYELEFRNSGVNSRSGVYYVKNWLSTNRPSFAAANQVVTLMRLTDERVV